MSPGIGDEYTVFSVELQAILKNLYPADKLAQLIFDLLYLLQQVSFCWVSRHVGILGKWAAKEACRGQYVVQCPIPLQAVISALHRKSMQLWDEEWLAVRDSKLRLVKSTIWPWHSSCWLLKKDEVTFTHLQTGLCPITHGFLLW
ncbi:uncharacterized protein LOC124777903 [Schistocerca piceifrons]|uniref:uncharacterized protein LOC124777903 n=1 Tax=Schistocerca piceifrons TaxID=274613 RepID=UPI001F5FC98E|nr:uncharacterized protein LOC124777903 [Schistocerca piceifrons]